MKIILLSALLTFLSHAVFAAPRFTSDYYKSDPVNNLNKVVTLHVTSAKPSSFAEMKGYVPFMCYTAYKNELGGIAWVYVPNDGAKTFGRQYGEVKSKAVVNGNSGSFPSKPVRVKMVNLNGEYVFVAQ